MRKFLTTTTALAVALIALPAQAITYIGNRTIGVGTAALSITTDDTLGILSAANIIDWTITVAKPGESALLNPGNSNLIFSSTALSATATQLLFDFDGSGGFAFAMSGVGNSRPAYCISGATGVNCNSTPNTEGVFFTSGDITQTFDGVSVLGSVGGGVPEPASWALMIAGFGVVGATARRRARVQVTYA